jgi:hypothetical protein
MHAEIMIVLCKVSILAVFPPHFGFIKLVSTPLVLVATGLWTIQFLFLLDKILQSYQWNKCDRDFWLSLYAIEDGAFEGENVGPLHHFWS